MEKRMHTVIALCGMLLISCSLTSKKIQVSKDDIRLDAPVVIAERSLPFHKIESEGTRYIAIPFDLLINIEGINDSAKVNCNDVLTDENDCREASISYDLLGVNDYWFPPQLLFSDSLIVETKLDKSSPSLFGKSVYNAAINQSLIVEFDSVKSASTNLFSTFCVFDKGVNTCEFKAVQDMDTGKLEIFDITEKSKSILEHLDTLDFVIRLKPIENQIRFEVLSSDKKLSLTGERYVFDRHSDDYLKSLLPSANGKVCRYEPEFRLNKEVIAAKIAAVKSGRANVNKFEYGRIYDFELCQDAIWRNLVFVFNIDKPPKIGGEQLETGTDYIFKIKFPQKTGLDDVEYNFRVVKDLRWLGVPIGLGIGTIFLILSTPSAS